CINLILKYIGVGNVELLCFVTQLLDRIPFVMNPPREDIIIAGISLSYSALDYDIPEEILYLLDDKIIELQYEILKLLDYNIIKATAYDLLMRYKNKYSIVDFDNIKKKLYHL